nr:hypothetical protein [uncultured Massilia sp.]
MTTTSKEAKRFQDFYNSWKRGVSHISLQYIAILNENQWQISRATLTLSPLQLEDEIDEQISTSSLKAGQIKKRVSPASLDVIISQAMAGEVWVGNERFKLPESEGISFHLSRTVPEPNYFPVHLEITSSRSLNLSQNIDVSQINSELRSGTIPFDGIVDLFSFFGFGSTGHIEHDQRLNVILHPPADILLENSSLSNNKLVLGVVRSFGFPTSEIKLGLRLFPAPTLLRRFQVTKEILWGPSDKDFQHGTFEKDLENCAAVEIMTTASGITVSRHFITDNSRSLNPRAKSYSLLDPDFKTLQEHLFCPPKESRNLEPAVATLLHLLGASSFKPFNTDAVDVIAETKGGRLALIECTTRVTDIRVKVGKLVNRRFLFQDPNSPTQAINDVLAILVVNIPRQQIVDEESYLNLNQVILITKENLEQALKNIHIQPDLDSLFIRAQENLKNHVAA